MEPNWLVRVNFQQLGRVLNKPNGFNKTAGSETDPVQSGIKRTLKCLVDNAMNFAGKTVCGEKAIGLLPQSSLVYPSGDLAFTLTELAFAWMDSGAA